MGDEPVVVGERGLLTVSDEVWDLAVRCAEVIGRLVRSGVAGFGASRPNLYRRSANTSAPITRPR